MDELAERLQSMEIAAKETFRFFDLPYELRLRVYELILLVPHTIDLDPSNYRTITPLTRLFYVSRRMHEEAYRVFYGRNTFRVFPIHGRFFHTKAPLLGRLPPLYRAVVTKLELRLGPGWTKPPRGWVVDARLGLDDMGKVRLAKIFVQCDPASDETFQGFRNGLDFYTEFCVNIVRDLMFKVPSMSECEFDAYPGVPRSSPLVQALLGEVKANNKRILWGPERGWDKIVDIDLVTVLGSMGLGG